MYKLLNYIVLIEVLQHEKVDNKTSNLKLTYFINYIPFSIAGTFST